MRLRIFIARVLALGRARRLNQNLQQELADHIEEATEEYVRRGLPPAEARRTAFVDLGGGTAQVQEAYRDHASFGSLDRWRIDLRQAARALGRSAGFSSIVLVVLAIGTGAITSVFALLNAIVLTPLPFPNSDRLVAITHVAPGLSLKEVGLSSGLYFHYTEHAQSFEALGVYSNTAQNLLMPGPRTERVQVTFASATVFQALGARPALGRLFTQYDGRPGFMDMRWTVPILLAHSFWVDHFAADPGVIGRILTIGGSPRQIVGVLPDGFVFPNSRTQIWMLLEPPRVSANFARDFRWSAIGRLRPGVSPAAAQVELGHILPRIAGLYPDATPQRIAEVKLAPIVTSLKSATIGDFGRVIWPLFCGMAFLLVIAFANAATLFLVRADHRRREIALRRALGAHRRHVARLFFVEALILTTTATAFGLLLAKGLLSAVVAFSPVELPRITEVALDRRTMAFAAIVAILMAVGYGALSLRRQGRSLTDSLLGSSQGTTGGRRHERHPLIALQVALALTLMVGSALMISTYRNLSQRELGFSSDRVLTMEIGLPYRKAEQHERIYRELVERIQQLPGVDSASASSFIPLSSTEDTFPVQRGTTPIPFKFFMPGYFQTTKTRILEGQSFAAGERVTAPYPVLVSLALARRLYPGEDAVGKTARRLNEDGTPVEITGSPVPPFTIVGIVGDVRETTLRSDPSEIVYVPVIEPRVEQSIIPDHMTLIVRAHGAPLALTSSVRDAVAAEEPGLSVGQVRTLDSVVEAARARETFVGMLLLIAAAVSLLLGVVGVYGSVAHVVRYRTREIGIRLALGARPVEVVRMVMTGSVRSVLVGTVLGLVIALATTRALQSLLFGVQPDNPAILVTVTGLLLSAAIAAALMAALRATHIAPTTAMRSE